MSPSTIPPWPDTTSPRAVWNHDQRPSTSDLLRHLSVEQLIREARDAGYDGSQSKLVRLIRTYVAARETCAFATWLGYADPTATRAVSNVMAGGVHDAA
jgi:hypothetical protein